MKQTQSLKHYFYLLINTNVFQTDIFLQILNVIIVYSLAPLFVEIVINLLCTNSMKCSNGHINLQVKRLQISIRSIKTKELT